MRNLFRYGGIAASVILIAFGAGSIAIGAWGIDTVRDNLKQSRSTSATTPRIRPFLPTSRASRSRRAPRRTSSPV